jgi:hypothetical protein
VVRRVYRVLLAEDPRPLRERLAREARRVVVAAAVLFALAAAIVVAALVLLVTYAL